MGIGLKICGIDIGGIVWFLNSFFKRFIYLIELVLEDNYRFKGII